MLRGLRGGLRAIGRKLNAEHKADTHGRPRMAYSVEKLDGFDALLGLGLMK
jgi:hypothetical protein